MHFHLFSLPRDLVFQSFALVSPVHDFCQKKFVSRVPFVVEAAACLFDSFDSLAERMITLLEEQISLRAL